MFDYNTSGHVDLGTIIKPSRMSKNYIPRSYSKTTFSKCPCKSGKGTMYINTTDIICNYMFGKDKEIKEVRPSKKMTRNEKRRLGLI